MNFQKCIVFVFLFGLPVIQGASEHLIQQIDFLDSEKVEWVEAHNHYRRQVNNPEAANMRLMTWDDELEELAKKVVRTCAHVHTPISERKTSVFPTAGENLYTGGQFRLSELSGVNGVTKLWFDEIENYHYNTTSCDANKVCGHYTQVIWATSYKVGCAVAQCSEIEDGYAPYLVSCNYGPGGNIYLQGGTALPPYGSGASCSQCDAGDLCIDQLCNNTARDIPFTTTTQAPSTTPEMTKITDAPTTTPKVTTLIDTTTPPSVATTTGASSSSSEVTTTMKALAATTTEAPTASTKVTTTKEAPTTTTSEVPTASTKVTTTKAAPTTTTSEAPTTSAKATTTTDAPATTATEAFASTKQTTTTMEVSTAAPEVTTPTKVTTTPMETTATTTSSGQRSALPTGSFILITLCWIILI